MSGCTKSQLGIHRALIAAIQNLAMSLKSIFVFPIYLLNLGGKPFQGWTIKYRCYILQICNAFIGAECNPIDSGEGIEFPLNYLTDNTKAADAHVICVQLANLAPNDQTASS